MICHAEIVMQFIQITVIYLCAKAMIDGGLVYSFGCVCRQTVM